MDVQTWCQILFEFCNGLKRALPVLQVSMNGAEQALREQIEFDNKAFLRKFVTEARPFAQALAESSDAVGNPNGIWTKLPVLSAVPLLSVWSSCTAQNKRVVQHFLLTLVQNGESIVSNNTVVIRTLADVVKRNMDLHTNPQNGQRDNMSVIIDSLIELRSKNIDIFDQNLFPRLMEEMGVSSGMLEMIMPMIMQNVGGIMSSIGM